MLCRIVALDMGKAIVTECKQVHVLSPGGGFPEQQFTLASLFMVFKDILNGSSAVGSSMRACKCQRSMGKKANLVNSLT
jgi:hypothetical protein